MKWKSNGDIKIVNYVTMNRWTTHMKDHVACYYATAYAWYAYDAALMSKIGQPENLLYTHPRISLRYLLTDTATVFYKQNRYTLIVYAETLFANIFIAE